jgi:hypothetical protein
MSDAPHHYVTARCILCNRLHSFDPLRVPMLHEQYPMCRDCTIRANAVREEEGVEGRWDTDESIWQPVAGLPE